MAQLNPEGSFDTLKDQTAAAVASHFPYEGSNRRLELHKVWVEDTKNIDDIKSQMDAKLKGRSWDVPVKAEVSLVDKKTGKVLDRSVITVAKLPKITRRYSYIVNGKEYQMDNQFRLKSGAYHREDQAGRLQTHWNLANWDESKKAGRFDITFDPKSHQFRMPVSTTKDIGLYPVLKAMGVSDSEMKKSWGSEIFASALDQYGSEEKQLRSLNGVLRKTKGSVASTDLGEMRAEVRKLMESAEVRADSTKETLGKAYTHVNGDALLRSSNKLLGISRGTHTVDDRESLMFKELLGAEDQIADKLVRSDREIKRRLKQGVDSKDSIREIINPGVFGKPIMAHFQTSLAQTPEQTNPLEFISGHTKTTILGPGGISDPQGVPQEALSINPSHLGFIDPIPTPEGEKTAITLQLPLGVEKHGRELRVPVYNRKTGKVEKLNPRQFNDAVVAFPDQVEWKGGKPLPKGKDVVVAAASGNNIESQAYGKVTHVMLSSKAMYSMSSNLMPFLPSNQGNRAMTAARQQEQAVPLVHREAPLVQSLMEDGKTTFEQAMGQLSSHASPTSGTVVKIEKDSIIVKDDGGKKHEIQIYDNFPLNEGGNHLNSTPIVAVGDSVKKGQNLADTNFAKNGELALGVNLRTAYMPFKGYNFEDGVVISESAAKKLTSEHMYRPNSQIDSNTILNKNKLISYLPTEALTKEQKDKLDDSGIIREGSIVNAGDVLIGKLQHEEYTTEQKKLQALKKSMVKPYRDRTVRWEKGYPGEVVRVVQHGNNVEVHIKTQEPAQIGDKLVGRHGNKGIISMVLPDHEMPHKADGNHVEIALNPHGVPSRINLGQVLETAAGKVAKQTGTTFKVDNFPNKTPNYLQEVKQALKDAGMSDTDELTNPLTGKSMGQVMMGDQYILKLRHQVDKKTTVRSGGVGNPYSMNMTPKGGGEGGGQAVSALGLYGLLSHGARHNIREMQTLKSDKNDELWIALQAGEILPTPKVPFTYDKLKGYLNVMGVNVDKQGNNLQLQPITDKQVRAMSNGELPDAAKMFRGKDMRPEKGGLFDENITGGSMGTKWSHFELPQTMPNPVFEKSIAGLLGIKQGDIADIISGTKDIDGATGPEAIVDALKKIDVASDLKAAKADLQTTRASNLNHARLKVRYLQALDEAGMDAKEAYTTTAVPVLPPNMRPVTVLDNGDLNADDLNGLYRALSVMSDQVKTADPAMPKAKMLPMHGAVYDGLKALTLTGAELGQRHHRGVMETIAGTAPKTGFYQDKVISRKQDLSMRGTIIPEDSMDLDEIGIPEKAAMELYKPFVVRELVKGFGYTPLQAQKEVKASSHVAKKALIAAADSRPVIVKRDPMLHKHGIMAFNPKIVGGKAIQIHPLVTKGYGADFDGDTMSIFVPLTHEAVAEAREMVPSKNVFNPATGKILQYPQQEAQLGVYQLSNNGKKTGHRFATPEDALKAYTDGKINIDDLITVGSSSMFKLAAPSMQTTAGRIQLAQTMKDGSSFQQSILTDPTVVFDDKGVAKFLTAMAKEDPKQFADTVNKLNQLGNQHTFETGFSFSLDDFAAQTALRDPILAKADKRAKELEAGGKSKNDAVIEAYLGAIQEIDRVGPKKMEAENNNVYAMARSGARGNWGQFKQITIAPLLVTDNNERAVPIPIKRSYSEGLSTPEYWASLSGARMGTLSKVVGASEPGALTKRVVNTTMNQIVTVADCGTANGVSMDVDDSEVHDRYLAAPASAHGKSFSAGTLLTPEVLTSLRNANTKRIVVRSPLKCEADEGLCGMCYGLDEKGHTPGIGSNLGTVAAQAIGEPAVNLSMKSFHTGGVVNAKSTTQLSDFARLQQLLNMPEVLKGSATLSSVNGTIAKEDIRKDAAGGWRVRVTGQDKHRAEKSTDHYIPGNRLLDPALQQALAGKPVKVTAGQVLSSGSINPREMLDVAGMDKVRNHLVDEMYDAYRQVGPVKRKNMEVVVRAITNLTHVKSTGDSDFLRGDVVPASLLLKKNKELERAGQQPAEHEPILRGINQVPLLMQEDWLARMQFEHLTNTVLEGAAQGWKSDIHGTHPIPAMVYGAEFGRGTKEKPYAY